MTWNRKAKEYVCDVCGEYWEEATYFLFIKSKRGKFNACDPIEQINWIKESKRICLYKLMKNKNIEDTNIEIKRIFGYGD